MCLNPRLYVTEEKNICNQPVLLVSVLDTGNAVMSLKWLVTAFFFLFFFFFFYNFQLQLVLFLASIKFRWCSAKLSSLTAVRVQELYIGRSKISVFPAANFYFASDFTKLATNNYF